MDRREAARILESDLSYTESLIKQAESEGHVHQIVALKQSAAAYNEAVAALKEPDLWYDRPLTMFDLRRMNGETVYCLELNADVKIMAPRTGWIQVYYQAPGEFGEINAQNLTLLRRKLEDPVKYSRVEQLREKTLEELSDLLLQITDDATLGFCKNRAECSELMARAGGIPKEKCRECLVQWLLTPGPLLRGRSGTER